MKAIKGKIIVKAYLSQKEAIQIKGANGQMIELWVGKKYLTNFREKNPVLCECVHNNSEFDYIQPGDMLIVHHNLLSDPMTNPFCIEYDPQTGMGLYSIRANDSIFCKLDKEGVATPICGNILVQRLKNPIKSSAIIIPDTVKQEHNDRVKVLAIAPEVEGVGVGETVLIYEKSDYEICYSWQKNDYSLVKIKEEEIIGHLTN